jgi:hypothetical protein
MFVIPAAVSSFGSTVPNWVRNWFGETVLDMLAMVTASVENMTREKREHQRRALPDFRRETRDGSHFSPCATVRWRTQRNRLLSTLI